MTTLQVIWFLLIGVLLVGYSILDGFDLGVGFWSLFTKKPDERALMMRSVGPFWDGNEVWLLTGGGALFAAFPDVYATVFSGFYLALMLLLLALIFRAVALEFRNKEESPGWRRKWDLAFGLGSSLPALLFGVALGNILRGIPLDADMHFTGNFFTLLNPFALLVGLLGFAMIASHGAMYLSLKTEGDLQVKARAWGKLAWLAYSALFMVTVVVTFAFQPQLLANYQATPVLWIIPFVTAVAIALAGTLFRKGKDWLAFLASSAGIAGLWGMVGASLFPTIVPALDTPAWDITVARAASSELTLQAMLIIALIGMPLVLGYTFWVYRMFKGKVTLDGGGY